jgi:hypothetical protein
MSVMLEPGTQQKTGRCGLRICCGWSLLFIHTVDLEEKSVESSKGLRPLFSSSRLPGDAVFIVGGAFPLVWLCWRAVRFPNPRRIAAEAELPRLLFTDESESRGS